VDTATTDPDNVGHSAEHPLTQQLTAAWAATMPTAPPPAAWLHVATATLTRAPAQPSTDTSTAAEPVEEGNLRRADLAAQHLQRLLADTHHHIRTAQRRRAQLAHLKAQVRRRAIDQLDDNPKLAEPLRDALADWGLPPINEDEDREGEDDA
jgi:hypothetical protein